MVEPIEIELYKLPNDDWHSEYVDLLKDSFINKKYNRGRGLNEKHNYINKYLPQLKNGGCFVLDVGPGFGEFMEICRFYGNRVVGIECSDGGHSMMGIKYHRLSKLLHKRQCLDVKYNNFESYIECGMLPFDDYSFSIINSQGSIEQVFKDYIKYDENKKGWPQSHNGLWIVNEKLVGLFEVFFKEMGRILVPGGNIIIYGNGSKNYHEYHRLVIESINKTDSLELVHTDGRRLHKIVKNK